MRKMHYLSFCLMFFSFLLSSFVVSAQRKRIVCVGNSITEGYGVSATENYPFILQNLLGTEEYQVFNCGASGHTLMKNGKDASGNSTSYWNNSRYQQALNNKPHIVIIKLGTNDAKPVNQAILKEEYAKDYIEMVRSFQALDTQPDIYICYPIPLFGPNNGLGDDRTITEDIIPMIDEVSRETGATVIDLHTPFEGRSYLVYDKVHPNATGHTYLAHLIARAICPECDMEDIPAELFYRIPEFDRSDKYESRTSSVTDADLSPLFDNNGFTGVELPFSVDMWISVELTAPTRITAYSISTASVDPENTPRSWIFQGSTDGVEWTKIHEQKDIVFSINETKIFDGYMSSYSALKGYKFYRLLISENNGGEELAISEWQLFGSELTLENSLLNNGGTITAEYSSLPNEGPSCLINKNVQRKYTTSFSGESCWVRYDSPVGAVPDRYTLTSAGDSPNRDPVGWILHGSIDGENWIELDRKENQLFIGRYSTLEYQIDTKEIFSSFRITFNGVVSGNMFQLAEWQLFGTPDETGILTRKHLDVNILTDEDKLKIISHTHSIISYEIYSVIGSGIVNGTINGVGEVSETLSSGIYLVKVNADNESNIQKVIIK